MDITQRVQVLIGGDASQAKKVIREVESELKASQARQRRSAASTGAQTGEAYGRAFSRAQDKWLKVAESALSRYGGRIGQVLAGVIGQYDKVGKAMEASSELRGGKGGALQTAGGSLLGSTIGSYVGTNGTMAYLKRKQRQFGDRALLHRFARRELDPNKSFFEESQRIEKKLVSAHTKVNVASFFVQNAGAILKWSAAIGVASVVVTGFIKTLSMLANTYKELAEKQSLATKNDVLINSINAIGNSAERTAEILRRFGENGKEAFAKLIEENRKLNQELQDKKGLMAYGLQANLVFDGISERLQSIREGIASVTGFNSFKQGFWSGTKEVAGAGMNLMQKGFKYSPVGFLLKQFGFEAASKEDAEGVLESEKQANLKVAQGNAYIAAREKQKQKDKEDIERLSEEKKNINERIKEEKEEELSIDEQIENVQKAIKDIKDKKNLLDRKSVDYAKLEVDENQKMLKLTQLRNKETEERRKEHERIRKLQDRDKYSISELSKAEGVNPRAVNAAKRIEQLEENAKRANANGNSDLADNLRNEANILRNQLGESGAIQSDEFGVDFKGEYRPKSVADLISYERKQSNYRITGKDLQSKIAEFREQQFKKATGRGLPPVLKKKTLDEEYAERGYIRVRPANGR